MIDLEIQALAMQREGLLIEVGRLATACGFTLLRQRLVQDPHGTLLSMVVRGSWFKKRALRQALEGCDRFISFELEPAVEGDARPHFAATIKRNSDYVPPPAPDPEPEPEPVAAAPAPPSAAAVPAQPVVAASTPPPSNLQADYEALIGHPVSAPRAPAPAPTVVVAPFEEPAPLAADEAVVEKLLATLDRDYARVLARLKVLVAGVAPGAREATLQLAGQRVGAWLHAREHAHAGALPLADALGQLAMPVLQSLAEVELQGEQLHIRHSALCAAGGPSGCGFYAGLLEGLLSPVLAARTLSVFPVCCCSFGAEDCVLALSE